MALLYRDDISLLFAGYFRHIPSLYIMPLDIAILSQTFYDKALYWVLSGKKLWQFICSDICTSTVPHKGDTIKLSNGKEGTITKFGCIYDEQLIGIQPYLYPQFRSAHDHKNNDDDEDENKDTDNDDNNDICIGDYGKLQGFTGVNAMFNGTIVKCYRFKYCNTNEKKQIFVQDSNNTYIIFEDQFQKIHDFIEYPENLIDLNHGDTIWRSSNKVKCVQMFHEEVNIKTNKTVHLNINKFEDDGKTESIKKSLTLIQKEGTYHTNDGLMDREMTKKSSIQKSILCHGNPMYLEYINYNNIKMELVVFPFGDDFGRTFAMNKITNIPKNVLNITAIFTFHCNQLLVEFPSQNVYIYKNEQIIEWDSFKKYRTFDEWKQNYDISKPLQFSLEINILHIEFTEFDKHRNGFGYNSMKALKPFLPKPVMLKEQLIVEIHLTHNQKLESELREMKKRKVGRLCGYNGTGSRCNGLRFYSDKNWRFYLEPKDESEELKMSIELMLLPPKIIAIEIEIIIANHILSNGKQFLFGNDGYNNICTIAFSHYANKESVFDVAINLLKIVNNSYKEVPKEEWSKYNIITEKNKNNKEIS